MSHRANVRPRRPGRIQYSTWGGCAEPRCARALAGEITFPLCCCARRGAIRIRITRLGAAVIPAVAADAFSLFLTPRHQEEEEIQAAARAPAYAERRSYIPHISHLRLIDISARVDRPSMYTQTCSLLSVPLRSLCDLDPTYIYIYTLAQFQFRPGHSLTARVLVAVADIPRRAIHSLFVRGLSPSAVYTPRTQSGI